MLNSFLINIYYYICLNLKANIMEYYDYQNEYPENECRYCGESCEKTYCDKQCERADED
jgi:hypothetical protein